MTQVETRRVEGTNQVSIRNLGSKFLVKDQDRNAGILEAGGLAWPLQMGSGVTKDKLDLAGLEDLSITRFFIRKESKKYKVLLYYITLHKTQGGTPKGSILPPCSVINSRQEDKTLQHSSCSSDWEGNALPGRKRTFTKQQSPEKLFKFRQFIFWPLD